jgi:hypothetical protein
MSRVFRFIDKETGAPQISAFPDNPPATDIKGPLSDLSVRILHFTEIENFGFLGYVLAHEIGEEELGDQLLDTCINWEHFVASTDSLMIPGQPLKITDLEVQAKIDALDESSEAQVAVINKLSKDRAVAASNQSNQDAEG